MKSAAILAACFFLLPALARSQANVNESLETTQLWVDTNNGSDSNPGTQQLPLKTISAAVAAAVQNNRDGIGTQVNVNPGTYREQVSLGSNQNNTSLPITLQAVTNGTVVVSGADIWTGWQVYSGNSQIYTDSWPYQWGLCPPNGGAGPTQQDILLRREMIAVNGVVMTQVLSLIEMQPGTFYVDESGATVYLWPPTGTDISTATVEVATRSGLFEDAGLGNLVVRGLTFQYDNSCWGSTAVSFSNSATNVLIDSDNFNWNNAGGLRLTGTTYFTVQNSVADHNGSLGTDGVTTQYGLWQGNQTSYNNWRGAQGAYYTWGDGGTHYYGAHNDTVSNVTAIYNQTHGFHWDTDNNTITASSLFSSENIGAAVLIEKSEGPISISGSNLCNGNAPANSAIVNGISVNNSTFVSLTGSTVYNGGNQVTDAGVAGGYMVTNWQTGQVYDLITQNLTLMQDTIEGIGSQAVFHDGLGGTDWIGFSTTLISDYNTWWSDSNSTPFTVPGTPFNLNLDFVGWKATLLTDTHSVFQAPSVDPSVACAATADAPDYWLLASAGSLTILPGEPAVFTVSVDPIGGFSGTVNLLNDGVQSIPGATATWSANSVTGTGTVTFTVNTSSTTPAGTYPVVMIGTSGSNTHTSTVSVVVDTSVGVSPLSLSFPNTQVGSSSAAKNVTLSNKGTTSLTGISISINGTNSGSFTETNTCGSSLNAGSSCIISVTFAPKSSGTFSDSLQITDSDPSSPQNVALTGTGTAPVAQVTPASLTFAGQLINTTSPAQVLTVTNTGTATLTISNITAYGSFGETSNCGTVSVNQSCTINVTFSPKKVGNLTGSVTFSDNGTPDFVSIPLTGTGIAGTATITPSSLTFPGQLVNTTSSPENLTVTNTGTATLTIDSITAYGSFADTTTCGSTLAVNASCTISVTFTPKKTGTLTGSLNLTGNGSPSQTSVTLTGTGIQPVASLTPSTLNFGTLKVGTTSSPQTATLTNTGTAALTITSVTTTKTDYAISGNTCGSMLGINKSCTITIKFTPKSKGTRNGQLNVDDNAVPATQSVSLQGSGS